MLQRRLAPLPDRASVRRVAWLTLGVIALLAARSAADTVFLAGGDIVHGRVVEQTLTVIVLDHEDLGRVQISRDRIRSIVVASKVALPESDDDTAAPAGGAEILVPTVPGIDDGPPPTPPSDWRVTVDLALTTVSGNTDEQSLRLGARADRNREATRLGLNLDYYWKASKGSTTDNKLTIGTRHDWLLLDSRWFWFANARFDWDEFESWEQRIAVHGGPGYAILRDEYDMNLDARAGIGGRKEFGSTNDDVKPELQLGLDYDWKITERQTFELTTNLFPVITDIDDYRTLSRAEWRWAMSEAYDISLSIGASHEFQSIVDPGNDKNDLRIWMGVRYGF